MNKTLKNAFRLDLSVSYREVQSKEEGNSVEIVHQEKKNEENDDASDNDIIDARWLIWIAFCEFS